MIRHPLSILAFSVSTLSGLCPAQAFTSPAGYESAEAPAFSVYFGAYNQARFQYADGEIKALGVRVLKSVGYRFDWTQHSASTAAARSWTNVSLKISDCDYDKFGATFASNPIGTVTTVYNAKTDFPGATGFPGTGSTGPAPWDKALSFPFNALWVAQGTHDVLLDYTFTGGSLNNGGSWGNGFPAWYHLDAEYGTEGKVAPVTFYGSTNCRDSAHSSGNAYSRVSCVVYPTTATNPANNNMVDLNVYGYRTAPGAALIQTLSLAGSTTSFAFPGALANCDQVFLDVTKPMLFLPSTAGMGSAYARTSIGKFGYNPNYVGITMWSQAVWDDSSTRQIGFTRATSATVPAQPTRLARRMVAYNFDPTASSSRPMTTSGVLNPVAYYSL